MEAPDNRLLLQIISPTSRFAHKSFCLQVCLVQKSSRQQVGSPTSHLIHESHVISHTGWLTQKSSLLHVIFAYKSFRLWVNSPTSPLAHRFLRPPVSSPTAHLIYWSVSPTSHLAGGLVRQQVIPLTSQFRLQIIFPTGQLAQKSICLQCQFRYKPYRVRVAFSLIFGTCTERLLRERELLTKIYLGTGVKFCQVCIYTYKH